MKSTTHFKVLPVAAAFAATLGVGLAGDAYAGAYAVAYNEITNFVIFPVEPGTVTGLVSSTVNSGATACLPNSTCTTTGGAGITDAAPALQNIVVANNDYTKQGITAFNYSRADASIDSRQTQGDPFTRARNIAEGNLITNTTANANAGNSSGTTLDVNINLTATTRFFFTFDLDPYIKVLLSDGAIAPSQADASISATINISRVGQVGSVFSWAPDGEAGGITGGTEIRDPFSSNGNLLASVGAEGPFEYDPQNCPIGSGVFADGGRCFAAVTNALAPGRYVINLAMREVVNLENNIAVVPEPATLGLLGLGLGMLGFLGRRRHMS